MSIVTTWQRTAEHGPGWYWLAIHKKYGDLYQVCALAKAFRKHHCAGLPLRLVVSKPLYQPIAELFAEAFDEIIVEPNFPNNAPSFWELYQLTQLPAFGPNAPILLQPHTLQSTFELLGFCNEYGVPWTELYKSMLRLPAHVEPALPQRRPASVAAAEAFCAANGIVAGKSVLLFPYAQSFPVAAEGHFAALAESLHADGYSVFTSIGPGETAIAGTQGVFIPFDILIDVANHAGWSIVIRSGIADLLAAASCRKTIIYRHAHNLRIWSLRALRLCCDADEISFDFSIQSAEAFTQTIRSGASLAQVVARPGGLSQVVQHALEEVGVAVGTIDFPRVQRSPERRDAAVERIGTMLAAGGALTLRDVPPRDHPYLAELVDGALARLAPLIEAGSGHCYAARDLDSGDFLEALSPRDLTSGRYDAASCTHSLIFSAQPLEQALPRVIAQFVLPRQLVTPWDTVAMSSVLIADEDRPATQTRPYAVRGYQLVSGWTIPEEWGSWSMGLRSVLKFQFENPGEHPARLVLDTHAFTSERHPDLACTIAVDGVDMETVLYQHPDTGRHIALPLGAQPDARLKSHEVTFTFTTVRSPMEHGAGGDLRPLGIGFRSARVELHP